jgi:hypothetical protein
MRFEGCVGYQTGSRRSGRAKKSYEGMWRLRSVAWLVYSTLLGSPPQSASLMIVTNTGGLNQVNSLARYPPANVS